MKNGSILAVGEMHRIRTLIALTTLILLTTSTAFLTWTYAFGPTCQYSSVAYNYPNRVSPGQQFLVSISLPAVCPVANNYHLTARFDVENSMNRVLASNFTQDGFVPNNGKPFTFTVTNEITAPSTPGPWQLQFIVYMFISEDDALGLDYQVHASHAIQVGQPIQPQTSTVTSTTTASSTLSTTTFPTTTQPTVEMTGPTPSSNELYQVTAAVVAVLLIITLILLIRRRTHSEPRH